MVEAIQRKLDISDDTKPMLLHVFSGRREEDFQGMKPVRSAVDTSEGAPSLVVKLKAVYVPLAKSEVEDQGTDDADDENEEKRAVFTGKQTKKKGKERKREASVEAGALRRSKRKLAH